MVWADEQTQGRGRFPNRLWVSKARDSLMFTLVIPWKLEESLPPSLVSALALCRALEKQGLAPLVKWPNDLMIHSQKVSGILCFYSQGFLHLGMGINLFQKEFPLQLQATSLSLQGLEVVPHHFLSQLLFHLYQCFVKNDFSMEEVSNRLWGTDRETLWTNGAQGEKKLVGQVLGLKKDGALELSTAQGLVVLHSGEGAAIYGPS